MTEGFLRIISRHSDSGEWIFLPVYEGDIVDQSHLQHLPHHPHLGDLLVGLREVMNREIRLTLDAQLLAATRRLALDLALERGLARLPLRVVVEEALLELLRCRGYATTMRGT